MLVVAVRMVLLVMTVKMVLMLVRCVNVVLMLVMSVNNRITIACCDC